MKQWLVPYVKIPTMHNPPHTAIVEAYDEDGARQLVRHRLNDFGTVSLYVIEQPREYEPGSLSGKILSMG